MTGAERRAQITAEIVARTGIDEAMIERLDKEGRAADGPSVRGQLEELAREVDLTERMA